MADGNFPDLDRLDAENRTEAVRSSFRGEEGCDWSPGETVWVYPPDSASRVPGFAATILRGASPMRYDVRGNEVSCRDDQAEYFESAVVRLDSGETRTVGTDRLGKPLEPEAAQNLKPDMRLLDFDGMTAMEDPAWMIEGLIAKRTSALLFGKSNAFKSFLAIDMACAVATGRDWHGHKIAAPGRVIYAATEGARGVGKQRIPGWMEAHGIPAWKRGNIHLLADDVVLDDSDWVDRLIDNAAKVAAIAALRAGKTILSVESCRRGAVDLVVIDVFGATTNGTEVSDETARAWVKAVNRIMRELGCAVLTVAHSGWADDQRARMHSHTWGSFDTRLKAEGDKESRTAVLTVERHKDADSAGQWGFRLETVTLPDGQTTLVPRLCDEVETTRKRRVSGKAAVALQALSEALIEHGRTIAGPNYPTCPVVSIEQWRAMCDRHGLSEGDSSDTARRTFNRVRTALSDKGLVRQFDGKVWKSDGHE